MGSRGYVMLAALSAVALAISACGGGGGDSSSSQSKELTRVEFVKQANSLCEQARKTTEARFDIANNWVRPESVPPRPLREKIIRFMVLQPTEALSQELQKIGSVSEGGAKAASYADVLGEEVEKAKATPLKVASGTAFVASDELAEEIGLSHCTF